MSNVKMNFKESISQIVNPNILIGKSFTTALNNDVNNIQFTDEYDFVELPCGALEELDKQINRCVQFNKMFALHYPSYHSVKVAGDVILENTEIVLNDILNYVIKYPECLYVVVHFPFEPFSELNSIEEKKVSTVFKMFSDTLGIYSEKVIVENLSVHRYCNTATHFNLLWKTTKTSLNMCFDIGHAFLVDGMNEVCNFFDELNNKIVAMHLYNTTRNNQSVIYGKHLTLQHEAGEINFNDVWSNLNKLPNLRFIIDESLTNY